MTTDEGIRDVDFLCDRCGLRVTLRVLVSKFGISQELCLNMSLPGSPELLCPDSRCRGKLFRESRMLQSYELQQPPKWRGR